MSVFLELISTGVAMRVRGDSEDGTLIGGFSWENYSNEPVPDWLAGDG